MGKITDIRKGIKNKERLNIFVDDSFSFAVYLDVAVANHLKIGAKLTEEEIDSIKAQDHEKYALALAMDSLSYKMRTEKELRDKLRQKEIPEASAQAAVEKMKELGYLDDENYAQLYAQELLQKFGGRLAVQKMMQKGIERSLAEQTVGGFEPEETVLAGHVARLRQKYQTEEPRKAKQKMIRALMSKGFEYDDIKRALGRDGEEE